MLNGCFVGLYRLFRLFRLFNVKLEAKTMEPLRKLIEFELNEYVNISFGDAAYKAIEIINEYPTWLPVNLHLEADGTWILRLASFL